MPSVMPETKLSDGASTEPARTLSELPQFPGRIAQYQEEFIVYDDGFRGWTFRCPDIACEMAAPAASGDQDWSAHCTPG